MNNNNISNVNTILINDQNNIDYWQLAFADLTQGSFLSYRISGLYLYTAVAADWAQFPANTPLGIVDMNNNSISNISNLYFNDTQIGGVTGLFDLSNNTFNMTKGLYLNNNNLTGVNNVYTKQLIIYDQVNNSNLNPITGYNGKIGLSNTLDLSNNSIINVKTDYLSLNGVPNIISASPQAFESPLIDIPLSGNKIILPNSENNHLLYFNLSNLNAWTINFSLYGKLNSGNPNNYIYFTLSNKIYGELEFNKFSSNRPFILSNNINVNINFTDTVSFAPWLNGLLTIPSVIPFDMIMYNISNNNTRNFYNPNIISSWTTQNFSANLVSAVYGNNIWLLFDSNNYFYRSLDNAKTFTIGTEISCIVNDSAYGFNSNGNPIFTIVGDKLRYSLNSGTTWNVPLYYPNFNTINGIAYGNGVWVAVGNNSTSNRNIIYSYDASYWQTANGDAFGGYGNKVAYGNGIFMAVGYQGCNVASIMTSPDGINWSSNSRISSEIVSVTYGPGIWIISDVSTNVYISSNNGSNWSAPITSPVHFRKITFGDTTIAAGSNGIYYSFDQGSSYGIISVANMSNFNSVVYANGIYVAIGKLTTGSNVLLRSSGVNTISYTLEPIAIQPIL